MKSETLYKGGKSLKTIVIYTTRYGSTEKYAHEIAKELNCPSLKSSQVTQADLKPYDVVILGSCLLEGQLANAATYESWIEAYPHKKWALFTVGLSNPKLTNFDYILSYNFKLKTLDRIAAFHFRGTISYKRLHLMQNLIKQLQDEEVDSIDFVTLDDLNKKLLEKYGTYIDSGDILSINELIDWYKKLGRDGMNE